MGNRAVITASKSLKVGDSNDIGVYLHWNGGRDSVEAFLKYCKFKEHRVPEEDNYGWARLCQVIGNFLGSTTSIGIDVCTHLDCNNWDNGVYIIEDWEIVDRQYFIGEEQKEYDLKTMLYAIDETQPEKEQLGTDKIDELLQEEMDKKIEKENQMSDSKVELDNVENQDEKEMP